MIQRNEPTPPKFHPQISAGGAVQGVDAPRQAPASVEITQWKGMASNFNPHILRGEYTKNQLNLMSIVFGQSQVRHGLRPVLFDED
jgi:hypothetical protein